MKQIHTFTPSAFGTAQGGRSTAETADTVCAHNGIHFSAKFTKAKGKNVPIHKLKMPAH